MLRARTLAVFMSASSLACGSEPSNVGSADASSETTRTPADPGRLWTGDASCKYAPNCPSTLPALGAPCTVPVQCDYTTSPDPSCGATAICGMLDGGSEAGLAWTVPRNIPCPPLRTGGDCLAHVPPIASSPMLIDCTIVGETCAVDGQICYCDANWVAGRNIWWCEGVNTLRGCACTPMDWMCGPARCDGDNGWQPQVPCPD